MYSHVVKGRLTPRWVGVVVAIALAIGAIPMTGTGMAIGAGRTGTSFAPIGNLDCNGMSKIQKPLMPQGLCTDIRGFAGIDNRNTWGGRFYDNGRYIGHDEPDLNFISKQKGSGNNVTWTEILGSDPAAAPTASFPGKDVTHYFELTPAPWFGMALCDPGSYPQTPCTPNSDKNAPACLNMGTPACINKYPGGGSAFLEMQFYPPGEAPFQDNISCDNTHWCASLHINEAECTELFNSCNQNCSETTQFAFIQTNGVPTGPPSPQLSDLATSTPNAETLLMSPGDKIKVHIFDAPAPAVPVAGIPAGHALETMITDVTTGQTGFMQASAANGFTTTNMANCSGQPFNYQPEYSTSTRQTITPWAALQVNVSTEFETGHFEPCTSLSDQHSFNFGTFSDTWYNQCAGPYETAAPGGDGSGTPEYGDGICYPVGDTHSNFASPPNEVTGCQDNIFQNGDLDFDGTPYYADWPTSAAVGLKTPSSFVQSTPTSNGHQYQGFYFQTDTALSEKSCNRPTSQTNCAVPPPGAPGHFFPYWSMTNKKGNCSIFFGNVSGPGIKTFGKDAQYGNNQDKALGYPEIVGKIRKNTCKRSKL